MLDEAARPATDVTAVALLVRRPFAYGTYFVRVEAALRDLDEHEVADDHAEQDEEERERQRGEAEEVGERRERQDRADRRRTRSGARSWAGWAGCGRTGRAGYGSRR